MHRIALKGTSNQVAHARIPQPVNCHVFKMIIEVSELMMQTLFTDCVESRRW